MAHTVTLPHYGAIDLDLPVPAVIPPLEVSAGGKKKWPVERDLVFIRLVLRGLSAPQITDIFKDCEPNALFGRVHRINEKLNMGRAPGAPRQVYLQFERDRKSQRPQNAPASLVPSVARSPVLQAKQKIRTSNFNVNPGPKSEP